MIRVLTVDDHAVVRSGIVALIESDDRIRSVGAVGGCGDAVAAVDEHRPDVVIADFRLTDGDGLVLCRRLERADWPARVLVFSGFAGTELVVAATVAGAAGVLGKGTAGELLLAAVRSVASGGMPATALSSEAVKRAAELLDPDDLPIFSMRLEGTSVAEIAEVLHLNRAEAERRVDRVVDVLKPRVTARSLAAAEPHRQVGRWL